MRLITFTVFLVLSVFASFQANATILAEPLPPAKFTTLYIERDNKGVSISIRLTGDDLIYKTVSGKEVESITIHPSGDDWFDFIKGLNDAKVYAWAPTYYYPGQGESWIVEFVMEDRKLSCAGTNEYPRSENPTQPQANPASGPSVPFQLFWQAALKLVGKAPAAQPK